MERSSNIITPDRNLYGFTSLLLHLLTNNYEFLLLKIHMKPLPKKNRNTGLGTYIKKAKR